VGPGGLSNASESQKLWSANRPRGDNNFESPVDRAPTWSRRTNHGHHLQVDDQCLKEHDDKLHTSEGKSMLLNGLDGHRHGHETRSIERRSHLILYIHKLMLSNFSALLRLSSPNLEIIDQALTSSALHLVSASRQHSILKNWLHIKVILKNR
jgi:hypothetical protein